MTISRKQQLDFPFSDEEMLEITKRMDAFKKTNRALNRDSPQLLKQFPDEWVAYFDQKMCGHNEDLDALIVELKEQGIPVSDAAFDFMDTNPLPLIPLILSYDPGETQPNFTR